MNNVLKILPKHLKYVFLEDNEASPVVISNSLTNEEESRLVEVLKKHNDVALCGACRPWIFFINGVFCSLKIMASEWRWKKDDWRCHFKEKMSQEEAHHHSKPWIRA